MSLKTRRFRRTTLIIIFCAAILSGLGLARLRLPVHPTVLVMLSLFGIPIFLKRNLATIIFAVILGLSWGLWRGQIFMQKQAAYKPLIKKQVVIEGTVQGDATYSDKSLLSFDVGKVHVEQPYAQDLVGVVKIEGRGASMVYKGDVVRTSGKLYATRGARQAGISFAEVKVLQQNNSSIDSFRRKFTAGVQTALPEPQASFGLGLLIGQRSLLPKNISDQLAAVGLTHLVAVSGYNLTILIDVVRRVLGKRSKYQATVGALLLVTLFILCTGWSASIVRAAIVSMMGLAAWYYGRTIKPTLLILFTAAVTAMWNPIYLWADVGWYLSFLAFFGVLIIAPLAAQRLTRVGRQPNAFVAILCESFSAQIMTIPIIMFIFGRVSLTGLLANMATVPLVPISMLSTLLAGLAGAFVPVVSGWFAWPAKLLLTYELDVAGIFSRLPHSVFNRSVPVYVMLAMYVVLAGLSLLLWFKTPSKPDIIMDEEGVF